MLLAGEYRVVPISVEICVHVTAKRVSFVSTPTPRNCIGVSGKADRLCVQVLEHEAEERGDSCTPAGAGDAITSEVIVAFHSRASG
jgi:hypothetical protein